MQLDPQAVAAGVRLVSLDAVGSTNAEAMRRGAQGEPGPLWIVARRQTSGRGRQGRQWISELGNLYATLLLNGPAPTAKSAQLAFVAGLAVHNAVTQAVPELVPQLTLKWPNDLLCNGTKLGGILIESQGSAPQTVVVGIGVNCRYHPDGTAYPATDLSAAGADIAPELLFAILSRTMLDRILQWDRGTRFGAIRRDWLALTRDIGREICVHAGDRQYHGRFEDLDEAGRLLLRRSDDGLERISAGDVFPLATAATANVG